jgi:G3E family GTPase
VDEWVELTNGCLCCSVKDDFVNALESLMLQQACFDYIIIETTGLANPGPVASALWTDEELEAGVCLSRMVSSLAALRNPRCTMQLLKTLC